MNDKLKKYLEKCSPAPVDQSLLAELRSVMEEAVPEIAERVRKREKLAAHLRIAASTRRQSNSERQD